MSLVRFADTIREYLSPATTFSLRYYRAQLKSAFDRKRPASKRNFSGADRPQVAVFEDLIPRPDRDAGSARMMFILRALVTWAHPVFLTTGKVLWPEYEELLWREGIETASAFNWLAFVSIKFASAHGSCVIPSNPPRSSANLIGGKF